MKNPDSKPLRIVYTDDGSGAVLNREHFGYAIALSNLAVAQSNLVKAGKDSAMTHFIAIVKELEQLYGFEFRIYEEPTALPQTD
jgi:hypothetical protein